MKRYTQRRRATAKSRAAKHPALRNSRPPVGTAPMAPRRIVELPPSDNWSDGVYVPPDTPDYWLDEFAEAEPPPDKRSNVVSYWLIAFAIALTAVAWWLL